MVRKILAKLNKKSKKSKKGFTLSETLVAMLIMSFVFTVSVAGVATSSNAFRDFAHKSEIDLLLSEATNAMRHAIRSSSFKTGIKEEDGKIIFENNDLGYTGFYENKDGGIAFTSNIDEEVSSPIIVKRDVMNGLVVKMSNITYDKDNFVVTITLSAYEKVLKSGETEPELVLKKTRSFTAAPISKLLG